ncbi:MAG: NUMOD3 domain-containing DNA-binding protein [Eubacteriales bacterium]
MIINRKEYEFIDSNVKRRKKFYSTNLSIKLKCDDCGEKYISNFYNWQVRYLAGKPDFCQSCKVKGNRNPSYGKDRDEVIRYARTFMKRNPMKGRKHSKESKLKMSEARAKLISEGKIKIHKQFRGHPTYYFSKKNNEEFYADSLLERYRMGLLDEDDTILKWTKKHKIRVKYIFENQEKYCVPDFFIEYKNGERYIEETKGYCSRKELIKKSAIKKYCVDNGYCFRFLTQDELNKDGGYRAYLKQYHRENV